MMRNRGKKMRRIYCATNKVNGKMYIGQTSTSKKKLVARHLKGAGSGMKWAFSRAIRKYGIENFCWTILFESRVDKTQIDRLEIFFITLYETQGKNGYNMTPGGEGGDTGITGLGRLKISLALKGRPKSEETKRKLSEARKRLSANPTVEMLRARREHSIRMKGRKKSEETKRKLSEAHKGKSKSANHRASLSRSLLQKHPARGKTYEEIYGLEKAAELREKRRERWRKYRLAKGRNG